MKGKRHALRITTSTAFITLAALIVYAVGAAPPVPKALKVRARVSVETNYVERLPSWQYVAPTGIVVTVKVIFIFPPLDTGSPTNFGPCENAPVESEGGGAILPESEPPPDDILISVEAVKSKPKRTRLDRR